MTEWRYLLTFDRMLPIGVAGVVLTALGRHVDPEPVLIIEDGRLVVVQPLTVPPSVGVAEAEECGTSAPASSPHPAVSYFLADGDSPAAPPEPVREAPGSLEASTAPPAAEAGAGAVIRRCAECGGEFIPWRKDQRFDSRECNRRFTSRRWAAKRREARKAAEVDQPAAPLTVVPADDVLVEDDRPVVVERPAGNPLAVPAPYLCEHCGAGFRSKREYGAHRAEAHPILGMPA